MTKDECGVLTYALDRDRMDMEAIMGVVRSQRRRGREMYPLRDFAATYESGGDVLAAAHRLRASTGFAPWGRILESRKWLEERKEKSDVGQM